MKKKVLVSLVATSLAIGGVVGGTFAFLTDTTQEVENTFTVGNVDITLAETTGNDYKMIPGVSMDKDPVVTVVGGSENCWLFVKVDESASLDTYIEYEVDADWKQLKDANNEDVAGVYYLAVGSSNVDLKFPVIENNTVTTKSGITNEDMDKITNGDVVAPTLTFKAYAIQDAGFETPIAAWTEVSK